MKWISQVWMLWVCVGFLPPVYGVPQKPVGGHRSTQVVVQKEAGSHVGSHKGKAPLHGTSVSVVSSVRGRSSSRVGVPATSSQALGKKGAHAVKSGKHGSSVTSVSSSKPQVTHTKDHTPKAAQTVGASEKTDAALQHRASLASTRQEIQKVKALLISAHDDTLKRQKTLQAVRTRKPTVAQDVSNALKETEDIRRALHEDIDALNKLDKAWQKDIQSANRTSKNVKPGGSQS
ncbi:hypothetical protein EIL50_02850 [bacterium NHP-B]|nr:hypothetical protein EIL50_02850 [bacterium NHP-B]